MLKTVAFIPVRLTSSRLPAKHLKTIGDRTLLSWVLKRLKDIEAVDEVVVCAPGDMSSEPLKEICNKESVALFLFEGDVDDVVGRLTSASIQHEADICVLASGDCPLLPSESIGKLIDALINDDQADVAFFDQKQGRYPVHEGFQVVRRHVWERANNLSTTPEMREHHFPIVSQSPELFSDFLKIGIADREIFYSSYHRTSIDTPSDLLFHTIVYDELLVSEREYNLRNVLNVLQDNKSLRTINSGVKQKGLYDKTKRFLVFVSAVSEFGYGNLTRATEVGRALIDTYGCAVHYIVLDEIAQKYLQERNYIARIFDGWETLSATCNSYDAILFDVNKNFVVSEKFLNSMDENTRIFVIDNIKEWTARADRIIVPTAHYAGKDFPTLSHGMPYVVIRDEVRRLADVEKRNIALIYSRVYRSFDSLPQEIKNLIAKEGLEAIFINKVDSSFIEDLNRSKLFVSHLSVSAYEAAYLGVKVVIIPSEFDSPEEIALFESFIEAEADLMKGNGGDVIAALFFNDVLGNRSH